MWLSSVLTKAKQQVALWKTLSQAIEEAFQERFESTETELQQRRSLFTMTPAQVAEQQKELGKFFSVIDVPDEYKGIALLHRLDDINLKATAFPIKDMIRRNFDGFTMDWSEVYAHIDINKHPYGTQFISSYDYQKLSASEKTNWFMTNRGRMTLTLNAYMPADEEMNRILNTIEDTIVPLVPINIVFDGFYTQVLIESTFNIHLFASFTNPITDTYTRTATTTVTAFHTERSIEQFTIQPDSYSLDADTKSIRLPFQSRDSMLLDEQPLDFMPIGLPYRASIIDPLVKRVISLSSWQQVNCTITHGDEFLKLSKSSGYAWHACACTVGKRYAIQTYKLNASTGEVLVCASNTPSSVTTTVISASDTIGEYAEVFQATAITMYVLLKASSTTENFFRKIYLYELNEN